MVSAGLASLAMLIDRGARLDLRDDLLKSTPLGWACRWGRFEMAEVLSRGALGSKNRTLSFGPRPSPGSKKWVTTRCALYWKGI